MSMEAATAFYEKLESDKGLQEKIQELENRDSIAQYVKEELGYSFSNEEMQKVVFERNPEMTDEELEAITGGSLTLTLIGLTISALGIPAWMGTAALSAA